MAEGKEYISCPDELGCIHISEDVLAVSAAAAALEVEGVGSLAANLGSDIVEMLAGRKNLSKGVRVTVTENSVTVDISILVKYGSSIPEVAKGVQDAVFNAIENASGFTVEGVNVHVAGITFHHVKKPH
ncbi:MAG: Asp23/Gls24 family envelope stress response protein [Pseudoflavonifractor sp.]|nr:Asp23/Gls24 family envelope stress response protein [Pseudoflavonifractor sp.]